MTRIGKKIISAFVEVNEKKEAAPPPAEGVREGVGNGVANGVMGAGERFAGHFDKLLSEANIPGPDYYEFARMIAVMQGIPDEAARYNAAFAGLQVQGLTKQRLLDTAGGYLRVLTDRRRAIPGYRRLIVRGEGTEKGGRRRKKRQRESRRCRRRSCELQQQIGTLQEDIRSSKEKLAGGNGAYTAESRRLQLGSAAISKRSSNISTNNKT
jgi:hypothetical protein